MLGVTCFGTGEKVNIVLDDDDDDGGNYVVASKLASSSYPGYFKRLLKSTEMTNFTPF